MGGLLASAARGRGVWHAEYDAKLQMLTDLQALVLSALLAWLMIITASQLRAKMWTVAGLKYAFGDRDQAIDVTPVAGRADRAARNMLENLVLFAMLVLAARLSGHAGFEDRRRREPLLLGKGRLLARLPCRHPVRPLARVGRRRSRSRHDRGRRTGVTARPGPMSTSLLGRTAPLATLRDALLRAEAGRGGLVLVVGEAGIGKTSLVEPVAEEAQGRGAEVVFGRAWEAAESPPYFPLWECFRSLGVGRSGDTDPFRLWEKVLAALAERASSRPVVWVLDDLHAADLLTLDLLTFLTHPARAMRMLILATARDHDPRTSARGAQRLARMARDGTEVRLGPLLPAAVTELVGKSSAMVAKVCLRSRWMKLT